MQRLYTENYINILVVVNVTGIFYYPLRHCEKCLWKGCDQNYDEFHEIVFDALDPAITYYFINNNLREIPILSCIYSLFD